MLTVNKIFSSTALLSSDFSSLVFLCCFFCVQNQTDGLRLGEVLHLYKLAAGVGSDVRRKA